MNVSAFTYENEKDPVSYNFLPAFLPFSFYAYQSVLLSLFIYFIRKVVDVVQFHILKTSNFKSSILQHSLLPYLQTESNVKSQWQQLSRVWIIIGFIASFIIHSKINNGHYISLMYY